MVVGTVQRHPMTQHFTFAKFYDPVFTGSFTDELLKREVASKRAEKKPPNDPIGWVSDPDHFGELSSLSTYWLWHIRFIMITLILTPSIDKI